jgi:hypothetical protein
MSVVDERLQLSTTAANGVMPMVGARTLVHLPYAYSPSGASSLQLPRLRRANLCGRPAPLGARNCVAPSPH